MPSAAAARAQGDPIAEGIILSARENFIDFPITNIDWEVAMIEATRRLHERAGYPKPSGFPHLEDESSAVEEVRVRVKYGYDNKNAVRQEANEIIKDLLTKESGMTAMYRLVLEETARGVDQEKASPPGTLYGRTDTLLHQENLDEIMGELPPELHHAILLMKQGVSLDAILAPVREGSAKGELQKIEAAERTKDGSKKAAAVASKPIFDARKTHLKTFLGSMVLSQ